MTENVKAGIKAQTDQLENVNRALTAFNATEAGLLDLHNRYDDRKFDVDDPKDMKLAKEARAEIRKPRFNVEKLRKAAKAPILELGRMIDADAKSLTKELLAIENPIDDQIKTAERREAKRLQDIDERLREFGGAVDVMNRYQPDSTKLQEFIGDLERIEINAARFEEFEDEAHEKKNAALETMRSQLALTVKAENDAAELAQLREDKRIRDEADAKEEKRKQDLADAAQAAVDEGQGNGSKGDAGTIFDDEPQPDQVDVSVLGESERTFVDVPPPIEEQLMRKPTMTDEEFDASCPDTPPTEIVTEETIVEAATAAAYPGRAGIVHAVATQYGVSEAIANGWVEKLVEQEALPF